MRACCPLVSSGNNAVQSIKTARGFAIWYSLCQAGGASTFRWGHPSHNVVTEVQVSSGLGPVLFLYSSSLESVLKSSQESYIGLTFFKKASLLWMLAPQNLWAWAIARTDQRLWVLLKRSRSGHWEQDSTIASPALHVGFSHHLWDEQQSNK